MLTMLYFYFQRKEPYFYKSKTVIKYTNLRILSQSEQNINNEIKNFYFYSVCYTLCSVKELKYLTTSQDNDDDLLTD